MSSSSDNEEFYDAEESNSPDSKRETSSPQDVFVKPSRRSVKLSSDSELPGNQTLKPSNTIRDTNRKDVYNNEKDKKSWNKFKELRQRMQTEEEDGAISNTSPVDSQVSSVDDVFTDPSNKMLHPFRVIEHDTISVQSMTSLGRVGRILSGNSEQNNDNREEAAAVGGSTDTLIEVNTESVRPKPSRKPSREKIDEKPEDSASSLPKLQEPDVIASTKGSNNFSRSDERNSQPSVEQVPIAPPRRKRKQKATLQQTQSLPLKSSDSMSIASSKESIAVYNSQTTIDNLTKELEHSLDIKLASKGNYVVKPQDDESKRADSVEKSVEKSEPSKSKFTTSIPCCGSGTYPLVPNSNCNSSLARNSSTYPLSSVSSHSVAGTRAGLGLRFGVSPQRSKERRKSTGDEKQLPPQLNMFVRTRTDSGKQLTDMEILEQVTVLNLDTGERVPLSIAEDKLPQCINPLSLHIMRLTSEYVSNSSLEKRKESDEESVDSKKSFATTTDGDHDSMTVKKRTAKLKRFLGLTVRKTVSKARTIAQEVSHVRHKEDITDIRDDVGQQNETFKLRASNSYKGPYEFLALQHVQELNGEHVGPVWCMKFSSCGRLLATAGQDRILRIWVVRNAYTYFQEMRTKYNAEKVSPTPSQESLVSQQSSEDPSYNSGEGYAGADENTPFMPKPFCTYTGHTSDLLDVSWSKNYFVLSSSMDKTVRLWHISRKECLCCFQHIDFVTAICFHPKDDRYFLSGSLDGKLRLWNIPDKKVAVWTEVDGSTKLITAANFCQNGKFAVVGSYDGRCIFYNTDQLRYHTQIHVRSTRGKNSRGRKISGIEPMPGEDKILVTSNDSRIRLYDLIDLNLSCKYKGYVNVSSQIKASFSHDGKFIICGSENQCIYIWKTHHDYSKFPSVRRDRNDFWEGIKAHNATVTCAIFAPNPSAIIQQLEEKRKETEAQTDDPLLSQHTQGAQGYVLVSADYSGCIRVFLNKTKPKHSSLPASALA